MVCAYMCVCGRNYLVADWVYNSTGRNISTTFFKVGSILSDDFLRISINLSFCGKNIQPSDLYNEFVVASLTMTTFLKVCP